MFKELAPILKKGDMITFTAALEEHGQLRVNVYPRLRAKDDEDEDAIIQPLTLIGTPEELDSPAAIEALQKFTTGLTGLCTTLDEAEKATEAAKLSAKAGKPKGKPAAPAAPRPAPSKPLSADAKKVALPARPMPARPGVKPAAPAATAPAAAAPAVAEAAEVEVPQAPVVAVPQAPKSALESVTPLI